MAYKYCSNCDQIINIEGDVCPYCGKCMENNVNVNFTGCFIALLLSILLWVSVLIYFLGD